MAPIIWRTVTSAARLSTVLQILLFLPLTLATLSTPAFLLLSLFLFVHSVIHGTMLLLWGSPALSFLQVPMHPFLLLLCFNIFSQTVPPVLLTAATYWGKVLSWSSPAVIVMEGLGSLLVAQKLGRIGRELAGEGEGYQFGLLVASAVAYVASAWRIGASFSTVATSPLSSTLLGAAMTAFVFLTLIGFALRHTNVVESSALALFMAYNIWLCGFNEFSVSGHAFSYAPLLSNIMPHIQTLINFVANTLPKPVLFALIYRLSILHLASYILPTIGADSWEMEYGVDGGWNERPTTKLTHFLLTYRQAILVIVYSHLLLLYQSSHLEMWWRWMSIFFTLFIWAIELVVSNDDESDPIGKEWKID